MLDFFRRFRWIGWGLMGIIIVIFAFIEGMSKDEQGKTKEGVEINKVGDEKNLSKTFDDAELAAAELALTKGILIEDPQNDWFKVPSGTMQPDGKPDNPEPYPLGWTDFRSVSVGADEKYIYFKFRFWDKFPQKAVTQGGDLVLGTNAKITNFSFTDKDGKKDTADLITDIWYADSDEKKAADEPRIGLNSMISPNGEDAQREMLFKKMTGEGLIAGGPGFDFFLAAFPLANFNLKLGDEVTFDASTETGSVKFHHAAIDNLLDIPNSKFGKTIKYKLGSDKYETVSNADYKNNK